MPVGQVVTEGQKKARRKKGKKVFYPGRQEPQIIKTASVKAGRRKKKKGGQV